MSIRPQDIAFFGGGRCVELFGVPVWRASQAHDLAATFTRSGAVGYSNTKSGALINSSADRVRRTWLDTDDDGVRDALALLVEPAESNYIRHSDDLNSGFWTRSNANATTNDATDPNGTTTASKLYDNSAGGVPHRASHATGTITAGGYSTITGFLRASEYDRVAVVLGDYNATDYGGADIDLGAATITELSGGDGDARNLYLEEVEGGWYYFSVTARVDLVSTSTFLRIGLHNGTSLAYTGDGASGVHVWRMGLAVDTDVAGTPIATTTAAVTRNAERLYADHHMIPQECSVYVHFREGGARADAIEQGASRYYVNIGGASNPTIRLVTNSSGNMEFGHDNGSTYSGSIITTGLPTLGQNVEMLGQLSAGGAPRLYMSVGGGAVADGGAGSENTLPAAWTSQVIDIGSRAGTAVAAAAYLSVVVARGTHSMAAMRAVFS